MIDAKLSFEIVYYIAKHNQVHLRHESLTCALILPIGLACGHCAPVEIHSLQNVVYLFLSIDNETKQVT